MKPFKGYLTTAPNRSLFVDFEPSTAEGAPFLVLLNGLTYSTERWDEMLACLPKDKMSVLRLDFHGQGKTLQNGHAMPPAIEYVTQTHDLHEVLMLLGAPEKVFLCGLSYGATIAMSFAAKYPERISKLLLMAPFAPMVSIEELFAEHYTRAVVALNPFAGIMQNATFDYSLRAVVYGLYPMLDWKLAGKFMQLEGIFRLIKGMRKLKTKELLLGLPKASVEMLIPEKDEFLPQSLYAYLWAALPENTKLGLQVLKGCSHKIPEAEPKLAALWLEKRIMSEK